MLTYLLLAGLAIAVLLDLRAAWLYKHDRCEPTATACTKRSPGHLERHHSAHPVPFHSECPDA